MNRNRFQNTKRTRGWRAVACLKGTDHTRQGGFFPGVALALTLAVAAQSTAGAGQDTATADSKERSLATLQQATAYALAHSAKTKAAFQRWQSALAKIPQAQAFPDPRLSYSYYIENVETRVGPQEHKISLQQTLPWFGKRALRGKVASAAAEAQRQLYEQAKLDVLYEVKEAYFAFYYLKRAIAITRENLELLAALEKVARTRYKAGGPMLPLVQLQTEQGKLDDRLKALDALRPARVARLNAALNRPTNLDLPWPQNVTVPDKELDVRRLKQHLAARNPMLKKLAATARRHETAANLAAKNRWPDVTLGMTYIDTATALNPGTPGSGRDPVMATVSVNLPIWRDNYAAEENEAELKRSSVLEKKRDRRNGLEANLETALFHYRDAGRKINLYGKTLVPKAEQSFQVARQTFEAGDTDFLSLIDAQRMLLEFELQYERARTERARRLAEIEKLAGLDISNADQPQNDSGE